MDRQLEARIATHLASITRLAPGRPPGSAPNRRATSYVAHVLTKAGWAVTERPFRARYWIPGKARLRADGRPAAIPAPPYSRAGRAAGRAAFVASLTEIVALGRAPDRVLVLRGDLARPIMPKAFPFVQDADQSALITALEAASPAAVLAIVSDEALDEPVFEDPDLEFLYATVPSSATRAWHDGTVLDVELGGEIVDGDAVNISAGRLDGERIVLCAHVDSKITTPGALDNGGGVASLLALAEEMRPDEYPLELVFFNGEDHYAAPGEAAWLAAGGLEGARLAINLDGCGLRGYPTAVSTLAAGEDTVRVVREAIEHTTNAVAGEPWFESDHAIFAMNGIPSVAVTSGAPLELLRRIAHLDEGDLDRVDVEMLGVAARFVLRLMTSLDQILPAAEQDAR